jgi:hypothetical protein
MERNKFNNLVSFFESQQKLKTMSLKRDKHKHIGFYDNMVFDIDILIDNMMVKNISEFQQK